MHVGLTVATDIIDIDVENVRAFAFLLFAERDKAVPVFRVQEIAHLLRAARVHAFADDQERRILHVRLLNVDRRRGGDQFRIALLGRDALHRFHDLTQVRRRCTATAAHDVHAKIAREVDQLRGKAFGRFVVVHLAFDH